MPEEKKNLVGPLGRAIVVFVAVMTIFSVGAITGMMVADENPKCPDCSVDCPETEITYEPPTIIYEAPDIIYYPPDIIYYPPNITYYPANQTIVVNWSDVNLSNALIITYREIDFIALSYALNLSWYEFQYYSQIDQIREYSPQFSNLKEAFDWLVSGTRMGDLTQSQHYNGLLLIVFLTYG